MSSTVDVDVIVVGAGLSGLTAAEEIQAEGRSCVVFEARDRVGGKTWSIDPLGAGKVIDVGAAWINDTNQSEVYALAKRLDLQLVVQNTNGSVIQEDVDGSLSTFEYGGAPDKLSETDGLSEMLRIRALFEEECQQFDIRDLSSIDQNLDGMTLQQWVESHSTSKTALASSSVWTRAMLGMEPSQVSAMFFLNYCKSGGGLLQMRKDTVDGGQYLRFVKGTQSLSKGLAAKLIPNTVHLSSPVASIEQLTSSEVKVTVMNVSSKSTKVYRSRHVIVSLPTTLYRSIEFNPPLPATKLALADANVQGYTNKIMLLYETPWWRKANPHLCGLLQSFKGPITVTRDSSVDSVGQYSLTCFLVGAIGRELSLQPQADRFKTVVEHINRVFGEFCSGIEQPVQIAENEWTKDRYSGGCPVPVAPPSITRRYESDLRKAFGSVHFIGTETAYEWKGYMDGAIRSGQRGAKEVLSDLST